MLGTSERPKKVVLVANTSWNIHNFRRRLITQLLERGVEVYVLAPYDNYSKNLGKIHYIELPMDRQSTHPLRETCLLARLICIFYIVRPDVILSYTPKCNIYAAIGARVLGIPIITNISGLGTAFIRRSWLTRVVKYLYRVALKGSVRVFFQNRDDQRLFLDNGLVSAERARLLPGSGVDLQRFSPAPVPADGSGAFVFLCVARMLKDKGIEELVEAVKLLKPRYPHLECRLLGFLDVQNPSAIGAELLQAWVAEGTVDYLGSSDNVVDPLRHCDCVVLPSYREGTPRSLLEAASVGKPIVTTDAVGCRETVEDGVTGLLCRVRDAVDLKDKMEKMLRLSEPERAAMGAKGREKMQREFDERIVIDRYLETISEILEERCRSAAELCEAKRSA